MYIHEDGREIIKSSLFSLSLFQINYNSALNEVLCQLCNDSQVERLHAGLADKVPPCEAEFLRTA